MSIAVVSKDPISAVAAIGEEVDKDASTGPVGGAPPSGESSDPADWIWPLAAELGLNWPSRRVKQTALQNIDRDEFSHLKLQPYNCKSLPVDYIDPAAAQILPIVEMLGTLERYIY
ncbi:hypothetical protein [Halarchaeum nitratireducens]|uniref:Uncharacterized protein n=1 Tax=Halarchaeum nitratireducens TaxID=489913 RepID=A0A830GEW9_9EURY|nr:hypothetical protein [Halarchaeum nitratireducens]GGN24540.1 hypothetical protein GCM10009021_27910 [Halarchaeum nitratireducens]